MFSALRYYCNTAEFVALVAGGVFLWGGVSAMAQRVRFAVRTGEADWSRPLWVTRQDSSATESYDLFIDLLIY